MTTTAAKQVKKTVAKKVEKKGPVVVPAPVKPSTIGGRAMLIAVTVHRWKPRVTDDEVGAKIAKDYNASATVGNYRKRLFPKETFFDTASVENEIRREFWERTLPWSDDTGRILQNIGFKAFMEKMHELTNKFDAEWKKVLPDQAAYDKLKAKAKAEFGSLYDETLYPSFEDACKKFGVEIRVNPIHAGEDFRVDLAEVEVERIRRDIDERAAQTIENAMKEVWGRLRDVVEKMVNRLNAYKVNAEGKVENTFRDSLVTNISDLLDLLPSLNVTQNPALVEFEKEIRKSLVAHPAEVLRDDEKIRKSVAVQAQTILDKMAAYF